MEQWTDDFGVQFEKDENGIVSLLKAPENITEYAIPDFVTKIKKHAFSECKEVTNITIPNSVSEIFVTAFRGCSKLTKFIVGTDNPNFSSENGLLLSNDKSLLFQCGEGLTSVSIPNSVTEIYDRAFEGCSRLTKIIVDADNPKFSSGNGLLLNKEKTSLLRCGPGVTSVSIPNSVTGINIKAFLGCDKLKDITIPNSVTVIGWRVFILAALIKIFKDCSGLININVDTDNPKFSSENGLLLNKDKTSILYCGQGRTSISIPNSVTEIDPNAFEGCSRLTSFIVSADNPNFSCENGLILNKEKTSILHCGPGVTSVSIPNSVTEIYDRAFEDCSKLTNFIVDDDHPNFACENGLLLNKDKSVLLRCGEALTSITIPNSVTEIGNSAFYSCTGLTGITIPNSVTRIGRSAFAYCESLTSITIPNSVTEIGNSAFYSCTGLIGITIPNSVTKIGRSTFDSCTGLTSITIPNSVTKIGEGAFEDCGNLVVHLSSKSLLKDEDFNSCTVIRDLP